MQKHSRPVQAEVQDGKTEIGGIRLRDIARNDYGLPDIDSLPRSASEALSQGSVYFYTGKLCKYGHKSPRFAKGGSCAFCTRVRNAKKSGVEFEAVGTRAKRYAARVSGAKNGNTTYTSPYPCKHGHYIRWTGSNNCVECDKISHARRILLTKYARIKKEYGLSRLEYLSIVDSQKSKCKICGKHEENHFKLHIDHCHSSSKVRHLLCGPCNQGLGLFKDNPSLLRLAAEYIENA